MPTAYIGIGSNIRPEKNIVKAVSLLSKKVSITDISTFYLTKPIDKPEQPLFYNGAARVETEDDPIKLKFDILREIEKKLGRIRSGDKSSSRTIDLDILVYDQIVINEDSMHIPDPDIIERPFLALPLYELCADMMLPGLNRDIASIARNLNNNDMKPLSEFTEKLRRMIHNGH